MRILLFFLLIFPFFHLSSEEVKIICKVEGNLFNPNLNHRFSKIIDFEKKTIQNLSGHSFDKALVFNEYELTMHNTIFDFFSTYNFKSNQWTIYNKNFIDLYKCKKRR